MTHGRKNVKFAMSVPLSAYLKCCSQWTDFRNIWYYGLLRKSM